MPSRSANKLANASPEEQALSDAAAKRGKSKNLLRRGRSSPSASDFPARRRTEGNAEVPEDVTGRAGQHTYRLSRIPNIEYSTVEGDLLNGPPAACRLERANMEDRAAGGLVPKEDSIREDVC